MAVILQKSSIERKGLIVLSHREKAFFDFLYDYYHVLMDSILTKYIIVIHVGGILETLKDKPYISKVFAADGNIVNISNVKDKIIPISSREFIPKIFQYTGEIKDIDLVIITNAAKHKKPSKIIDISLAMMKSSKIFKAFFIVTFPSRMIRSKFDLHIEDRFWTQIPSKVRHYFSFLSVYAKNGLYPLPRWVIAKLYKSSRYYVHTCEKEGESRAIGEALLAHNIVLAPANLVGGARTLVESNNNCYFYKNIQEASDIILMNKYEYLDASFEEMMKEAEDLFLKFYQHYKLGTEANFYTMLESFDLSMAFPGHINAQYLEESTNKKTTADIGTSIELEKFLSYIGIEHSLNRIEYFRISLYLLKQKIILILKTKLQPIKVFFNEKNKSI